jgi:hypothetical protein
VIGSWQALLDQGVTPQMQQAKQGLWKAIASRPTTSRHR